MSDFGSAFPLGLGEAGHAPLGAGLNSLQLSAELVERGALRYTPAGVPAVECQLAHSSLQVEAGIERQVHLEISAIALADVAGQLAQINPGTLLDVSGFLAPARKGSRTLRLHLTRIVPH